MSLAALLMLVAAQGCQLATPTTDRAATLPVAQAPTTPVATPTQTSTSTPIPRPDTGLCLTGAEAEHFLETAEIVEIDEYQSKGITHPRRATLSDGVRICRAQFKDIDKTLDREQLTTGKWLLNLKDSYKHEIAAWKLDQLLGFGLVPPCVERTIHRDTGSLCMWIEGAMTEHERDDVKKIRPPSVVTYNDQMHDIKLFLQLTWDTDYNNTSNILIDKNWKLYKIDSSRAFRTDPNLRRGSTLTRFRRRNVEALRSLSRQSLDESLGPWLDPKQIDGLWKRRGKILQLIDNTVDLKGEAATLYD